MPTTMNAPSSFPFHRLFRGLLPALFPWAFALQAHASPVFEPVQAFVPSLSASQAKLIQASDGNFYGTTSGGGANSSGTVFKLTPSGTLTTLVNFDHYTNGSSPRAGLIQASDGNFYGTTSNGGGTDGYGDGTVFKLTPSGTLTTLVNFYGSNGSSPQAGLIQASDGNLYGTTYQGGTGGIDGYGTIFKLTLSGTLTPLVYFNGTNGRFPYAGLIQASDGNFYGTTSEGGTGSYGTVFKLTPSGTLTTLVNFNSTNGRDPQAGLIQASDGNFYGTTSDGGTGSSGTVFKLTPSGTFTTLVNFNNTNGKAPSSGLIQASDGNFYGTTSSGGTDSFGTVFNLTPSGTLTTLVNFTGSNGSHPSAELIQANDGNLYGTTTQGGTNDSNGYGTVFKLTTNGTLTTLVNFKNNNGSYPSSGLIQASDGNFYGTTEYGGRNDSGTIFKLTPSGTLTTLVNFDNSTNGYAPEARLIQASDGNFYGSTSSGGTDGDGTVFKLTPSGTLTTLVNFNETNGSNPSSELIQASDGNFYGTTTQGGINGLNFGTVFQLTPSGTLTTLVNFNSTNGNPASGLIQASDGNFYGTTSDGGTDSSGTVFKLTPSGTLTTLVNFTGSNGSEPYAGLIQASDGNFYGTTSGGGTGRSTVFKLTPSGTLTTLVNFTGSNGSEPYAGLIQASDGNLYGTTTGGGSTPDGQFAGRGQIFRLRLNVDPDIALEAPTRTPVTNGSGTLAYGSIVTGQTKNLNVTVRNTGGADLTTIAASLTGPGAGQFALVSTPPATLAAGASAAFTLRFSPTTSGAKTATLSIASNDPDENPFDINLTGTGTVPAPEIVVEQPVGSSLVDGTAKKSFGTVKVGKTGTAKTFTIKNTGTANLIGLAITKDGKQKTDFIVGPLAKTSLAPGASTTFKITFKPTAKGIRNAVIHIKSNDANENPFDIKLTGAGAAP